MRKNFALPLALLLAAPGARAEGKDCCHPPAAEQAAAAAPSAPPAAEQAAAAPSAGAAADIAFPDEALVDHEGAEVRLREVIAERIVVMDFVFTTCTTVCPLLSGIMTGVQDALGGAPDVALVSVTVDPARDTPGRLAEYAAKWRAKPAWRFLTGERDAIRRVLEAAGAYTPDFTRHPPMVLVGDGRTGRWVRLNGFPKRAQVLAEVEALRARRGALSAAPAGRTP